LISQFKLETNETMQEPCSEKCLPSTKAWNLKKCPGKGFNHCVECYGFYTEDQSAECGLCGDYWCRDADSIFAYKSDCDHPFKSEVGDIASEEEIKKRSALEKGICPPCFLINPSLHCTIPGCSNNYNDFMLDWIDFCTRPVILGRLQIESKNTISTFEISFVRVPKAGNAAAIWSINQESFHYKKDCYTKQYTNIDALIEKVKKDIEAICKRQPNIAYHIFEGQGILAKSRLFPTETAERDHSPVRKTEK
jgi:hypothetical protein